MDSIVATQPDAGIIELLFEAWLDLTEADPRIANHFATISPRAFRKHVGVMPVGHVVLGSLSKGDTELVRWCLEHLFYSRDVFLLVPGDPMKRAFLLGSIEKRPWLDAPNLWICLAYVAPSARGEGLLDSLVSRCVDKARLRGCAGIWLECMNNNTHAIAAWEHCGFSAEFQCMTLAVSGT